MSIQPRKRGTGAHEQTINTALGEVLHNLGRSWTIRSETVGIIFQEGGRPDILIEKPDGWPIVIEAEVNNHRQAEIEAQSRLGRVDKSDPDANAGEQDEAEKACGCMVVACCNTSAVLEAVDEPLDTVAHGVDRVVDGMLDQPVAFGWDFRSAAASAHIVADRIAVIATIAEQNVGIAVAFGHQVGIGGAVVGLAGRQNHADGQALAVGAKVDFGREATARAAKTLVLNPPFAPAAQWCARTMVLSIICKASASPPPSASACNSTSQMPLSVQRRNCRQTEFQLPSSLGRSRQGAPVRAIQNTASSTRRWSRGGRPPEQPRLATNGRKNFHSSSLSKPRITADLPPEDQLRITSHRVGGIPLDQFVHAA
jgi:hypothetical protein